MIDILLLPFDYQFMINAMLICTAVGIICALLSSFLVLNNWSLIGDALSHAVVPGVAIAYWLSLPFIVGAFFSGIIAAFAMVFITKVSKLKEDVVIGFVFSSFFALGLLLISIFPIDISIQTIIMGTVYTINQNEYVQIAIVFFLSLAIMVFLFKNLVTVIFDSGYAHAIGVSELKVKLLFFTILSAVIVISLQAVGAILVIALLIIPGSCAYLLSDRIGMLAFIAMLTGGLSAFFGSYFSFFLNVSAGPVIVLIQGLIFVLCFIFAPKHGLLNKLIRRRKKIGTYHPKSYLGEKHTL
ncbi:metal ABC transporter permease [Thorsellia anophelis]|uniref:Manganese/iron transport system permease protein n=1 Tax=Thorsellia anophelis DSM 18579 TaxID=1123402 RepID=A0A1I0BPK1_9GAMM|nr:metal ABC transporter permease [Thorsellia anophelis]SET08937.1 manganese/iron transport system permease protein [Thorsellia anophelis DSM 18579]